MYNYVSTIVLLLMGTSFMMETRAQESLNAATTCNLTTVPANAIRSVSLGGALLLFHFPDPRKVSQDFSGCLNVWAEGGIRTIEAQFLNGKIQWYKLGDKDIFCVYENDRVVKKELSPRFAEISKSAPPGSEPCPSGEELVPSKWR